VYGVCVQNGMSIVLNQHQLHPEILATYVDTALHGKRGKDSISEGQIDEAVTWVVDLLPYMSVSDNRRVDAVCGCAVACRLKVRGLS
jgi:hypothetical protein